MKIDFGQTPHNIITDKKKYIIEIEKYRTDEMHLFICKPDFEKN